MLHIILVLALLALAAYAAYSAKTPTGWDWKKGLTALGALAGAVWAWMSGLFQS